MMREARVWSIWCHHLWHPKSVFINFECSVDRPRHTCLPAISNMAALSVFLKSSMVFTFLILPSARMWPAGTLLKSAMLDLNQV
jgi:hypothetical protein